MTPAESNQSSFEDDNDALHILPLARLPLKTPALRRARVIKNARLEGMVELFAGGSTGSGQIYPADLSLRFEILDHADIHMIEELAKLASYDVYSLRLELRQLGIKVEGDDMFQLSPKKVTELAKYMTTFTRPLVLHVFGSARDDIRNVKSLLDIFRDPNVEAARRNLAVLAQKLKLQVEQVPAFLADYGDVYLSLSYYQDCLDTNVPSVNGMLAAFQELRDSPTTRHDQQLMAACDRVEKNLNSLVFEVSGLTEMFRARTQDMWDDISPQSFRAIRDMVAGYHVKVGGNLCIIAVKMAAWSRNFPRPRPGGVHRKANVILSDILPGMDRIDSLKFSD